LTDPEELLAALDDAEIIGTVTDAMGDFVKVGVIESAVLIGVKGSPAILDTAELRDEFGRLYAEACRRAEATETEAASS
jgi:F420-0:gamma-glutamyl ligase